MRASSRRRLRLLRLDEVSRRGYGNTKFRGKHVGIGSVGVDHKKQQSLFSPYHIYLVVEIVDHMLHQLRDVVPVDLISGLDSNLQIFSLLR